LLTEGTKETKRRRGNKRNKEKKREQKKQREEATQKQQGRGRATTAGCRDTNATVSHKHRK